MTPVLDQNDIAFLEDTVQDYERLHGPPALDDEVAGVFNSNDCTRSGCKGLCNDGCEGTYSELWQAD